MASVEKESRDARAYVKAIQTAVQRAAKSGSKDLAARIRKANESLQKSQKEQPTMKLAVNSEMADKNGLRVTCPSKSTASVEIASGEIPHWVEFYLTRPRSDGVARTHLIGRCKYPDGDGAWNIGFTTERFAYSPNEPIVLHVEAVDVSGRLVAANALMVVV